MAKKCPVNNQTVLYLDCQECDDKICEKETDKCANDRIYKTTTIKEIKSILMRNGVSEFPYGWEITIGMLLSDCDYIELVGYGQNLQFKKCTEVNNG